VSLRQHLYMVSVTGLPTFFLDADLCGITGEAHATMLACKILGRNYPDALTARMDGVDVREVS
jgi:hypothetical protein